MTTFGTVEQSALAIHSDNNRAYCLVVMRPRPRDAVNRNSPGFLLVALM